MFDAGRWISILVLFAAPDLLSAQTAASFDCKDNPREERAPLLCAPANQEIPTDKASDSVILLNLPVGTTLRVAIDKKVRVSKAGQPVTAKLSPKGSNAICW